MESNHEPLVHVTASLALDDRDVALVRRYAICSTLLAALLVLASVVARARCATHGDASGAATMEYTRG